MRVVTPGTVTDEALLEERRDTLLAALAMDADGAFGLAWLDLSAGRFSVMEAHGREDLAAELERLRPAELLLPEDLDPRPLRLDRPGVRSRPPWHFDAESAVRQLTAQFKVRDLAGFGCEGMTLAIRAAGALLSYVRDTQRSALPHLTGLTTEVRDDALQLDPATRRNLELDESLSGRPEATLAGVLDRTATAMGGRELRRWMHRPLRERATLERRYHAIETLIDSSRREALRGAAAAGRRHRAHPGQGGPEDRAAARPGRVARRARRPAGAARRCWPAWTRRCSRTPASAWRCAPTCTACWNVPSSPRPRTCCATAA